MPTYVARTGEAFDDGVAIEFSFTINNIKYEARVTKEKITGSTPNESAIKIAQWILDQRPLQGGLTAVPQLTNRTFTTTTHIETRTDTSTGETFQVEIVDSVVVT